MTMPILSPQFMTESNTFFQMALYEKNFFTARDTIEEKSGSDITETDRCSVHRNGISMQQLPQLITSQT